MTTAWFGNMPVIDSMSSTRAGSRDSMPSTGMAFAIDSSMSSALGIRPIRLRARSRIASVSCTSRQGVAQMLLSPSP